MRNLKAILLALAAMTLALSLGTGVASATTLEVGKVTKNESVVIEASLNPGTSTAMKTTAGQTLATCASMAFKSTTPSPFTGSAVLAPISTLTGGPCFHLTVLRPGKYSFASIPGTTNGTVNGVEMEWRVTSTIFGINVTCSAGEGTHLGTLTGVASGHATLHTNAVFNCGAFHPSVKLEGTYTVTSPTGLGIVA
jgi:hypothetical protein